MSRIGSGRAAVSSYFGIQHAIFGFSRSPAVVAEVSRAGGLGVLAASPYTPAELDRHLTWIAQASGGRPFGVDLLVPAEPGIAAAEAGELPSEHVDFVRELLSSRGVDATGLGSLGHAATTTQSLSDAGTDDLLEVTFAHRPALVANALGPAPVRLVEEARRHEVAVAALIGTPEHAARQLDVGVDLLVAQGTEAGGHTGEISTMVLTPEVVELAGDTPVLAAGGIARGTQMAAALALGAAGVWCGSVWLTTPEDVAPAHVKAALLAARSRDTIRSRSRTGKPARQLRSAWHEAWHGPGAPEPLPMAQQLALSKDAWALVDQAIESGHEPARDLTSFFVGQVVGTMNELKPTADVVTQMADECAQTLARLAGE